METYLLNSRPEPDDTDDTVEALLTTYRVVFDDHGSGERQQLWRVDVVAHSSVDAGRAVAFAQGLETPAILAIIDVASLR